jgi:hypothetical protein
MDIQTAPKKPGVHAGLRKKKVYNENKNSKNSQFQVN